LRPLILKESEGTSKANSGFGTNCYTVSPMQSLIHFLIRLLSAAFIVGAAGCALLIPVVAFKFVAVLFEKDPEHDPATE
jgi:hypothetical protein